jgi:uncharacterized protein (DUF1330 family)
MPKAYVICDVDVTDETAYVRYRELSTIALERSGGRFAVRGGPVSVLEGDWNPQRIVVLEFDDADAARAWYDSPEYRAARAARQGASISRFILVEGAPE